MSIPMEHSRRTHLPRKVTHLETLMTKHEPSKNVCEREEEEEGEKQRCN